MRNRIDLECPGMITRLENYFYRKSFSKAKKMCDWKYFGALGISSEFQPSAYVTKSQNGPVGSRGKDQLLPK